MVKNFISPVKKIYDALSFAYSEYKNVNDGKYQVKNLCHIGRNSVIGDRVSFSHPQRIHIGDYVTIQNRCALHSMGGIYIGNYVGIGYGSILMSFVHNYNYCGSIPYDNKIHLKPVVIRDFAWLGWRTMINPGVEIGEGAIVGLGAVVTEDVPPLAIVMGNPASVVGYRSKKAFDECKQQGRMNSHRILETFGQFEEKLPLMMKRKFEKELKALGLL